MPTYTTPGVYVVEQSAFPSAITALPTAVAVFIGYTQQVPRSASFARVDNLFEYEQQFGKALPCAVQVVVDADGRIQSHHVAEPVFSLYYHVNAFFQNGGTRCFVISVGDFSSGVVSKQALLDGISQSAELDVQLMLIPEMVQLSNQQEFQEVCGALLTKASELKRFALLDCYANDPASIQSLTFSDRVLTAGAAYHPFVVTSIPLVLQQPSVVFSSLSHLPQPEPDRETWEAYSSNITATLPPASAIAGIINQVDNDRGVWKAPANVSLNTVKSLTISLNDMDQQNLTSPTSSININVLRFFSGKGILVWGARTLGGSAEFKYIPVKRLGNMMELSIEGGLRQLVFEPNIANTWIMATSSVENFMQNLWNAGALMGQKPEEAYFVKAGLNATMTAQDVLDGRLIVEIGFAPMRPAEFVIMRITQQMLS